MERNSRLLIWLTWGLVAVYGVVSLVARPSFSLTIFGDIAQFGLILLLVASFAINIHRSGRARLFWSLMTAGGVLWMGSQLIWSYHELYHRTQAPTVYLGDVLLFLHLVPMMSALLFNPHEKERLPALSSLTIGMIAGWWIFLYVYLVLPWQYVHYSVDIYGTMFSHLYAVEGITFITALAILALRSSGAWQRTYLHLFVGMVLYTISARAVDFLIQLRVYYTGSVYDLLFLVPVAWLGTAAARAIRNPSTPDEQKGVGLNSTWMDTIAIVALLSIPLLGIVSVYSPKLPTDVRDFRIVTALVALFVLTVLVYAKQTILKNQVSKALGERERSFHALAETQRELEHRAAHDQMTGVLNRNSIIHVLERTLDEAKAGSTTAVLMIDLDHFKRVNDTYGHHAGDLALMLATARFKESVRNRDQIGRYGGEEFLIVLPDCDEVSAIQVAERIRSVVCNDPVSFNGRALKITVTVGVAVSKAGEGVDMLLRRADMALYSGKKLGRNRVERSSPHHLSAAYC